MKAVVYIFLAGDRLTGHTMFGCSSVVFASRFVKAQQV